MMSRKHLHWLQWFCTVAISLPAVEAAGHGIPIHVDVVSNQLTISQGYLGAGGFASQLYAETNEDGDASNIDVPGLGAQSLWQLPGFEIFGMADTSSLSIEVLPRPTADAGGVARWLWYWNPAAEKVSPADSFAEFRWLARQGRSILIKGEGPQPPPLLLSDPVAGQTGFHNHSLLAYALDSAPVPAAGAYGMFARLTSNQYAASAPFLLVFNNGVAYDQMLTASADINRAAFLPGDYNHDDAVTSADFAVWKSQYGQAMLSFSPGDGNGDGRVEAADYTVWRNHLGAVWPSAGSAAGAGVPEPAGLGLALLAGACNALPRRRRARGARIEW